MVPYWTHTGDATKGSHGPLCPYIGPTTRPLPCPPYKAPRRPIEALYDVIRQRYPYRVTRSAGVHTEFPAGIPEQGPSMSVYRYVNRGDGGGGFDTRE